MTKLTIHLESLKPQYLDQVVELDQICLGGLWNYSGYQREIDSPSSTILVINLIPNDQIIGIGCYWAILEEAHITVLGIAPDYQRQGLGQFLLSNLLQQAIEQKLERATLEVKTSNQTAINLYQKFGFKIAGVRKGYYQKTGEDALILWQNGINTAEFREKIEKWQKISEKNLEKNQWNYKKE